MRRLYVAALVGGVMLGHSLGISAQLQLQDAPTALKSETPNGDLPALPPAPKGKTTILGGEIRTVDPVRDEITLKVFGQRPMKILFDERTQVFRDGKKIPLRDLASSDHASIESLLDGTNVYAMSIHLLSQTPDGEDSGRVISYNPDTRELTLRSAVFDQPVKIVIPDDTPITRVGQAGFTAAHPGLADLTAGSLISIKFQTGRQSHSVAKEISVLASPGSDFVFSGNLSALDMHAGTMFVLDPRDGASYQLSFDASAIPQTRTLHMGDRVLVTAIFDGKRYVTKAITVNN